MLLDRAIRSLPATEMVLYRGMSRNVQLHEYPPGLKGAWGGVLSASSDRMQVPKEGERARGLS